jgi:hypothetical protein
LRKFSAQVWALWFFIIITFTLFEASFFSTGVLPTSWVSQHPIQIATTLYYILAMNMSYCSLKTIAYFASPLLLLAVVIYET